MDETRTICQHCGAELGPDRVCLDCTVTDIAISPDWSEPLSREKEQGPPAALVESHSQRQFAIASPKCRIGRDGNNQIVISDDPYTSRFHAWITFEDGHYFVEDLGSTNGTLLNGSPLTRRRPLVNGDRLRIGRSDFTFTVEHSQVGGERAGKLSRVVGEGS